jgi:nitroreductase
MLWSQQLLSPRDYLLRLSPKMKKEAHMKDVISIIHQRKSVRSYTKASVNRESLSELTKAGMAAPSAGNKQPWAFIVVDDRSILDALGAGLPYAKMLKQAPAAIIVCGDLHKAYTGWEQNFWVQDCSAAAENILLAAEAMGFGAVWTGVYPDKDRDNLVRKILNLPRHIIPLNVIPLGHPMEIEKPKNKWNKANLIWNKWQT